jgi:hypothetical protein
VRGEGNPLLCGIIGLWREAMELWSIPPAGILKASMAKRKRRTVAANFVLVGPLFYIDFYAMLSHDD